MFEIKFIGLRALARVSVHVFKSRCFILNVHETYINVFVHKGHYNCQSIFPFVQCINLKRLLLQRSVDGTVKMKTQHRSARQAFSIRNKCNVRKGASLKLCNARTDGWRYLVMAKYLNKMSN